MAYCFDLACKRCGGQQWVPIAINEWRIVLSCYKCRFKQRTASAVIRKILTTTVDRPRKSPYDSAVAAEMKRKIRRKRQRWREAFGVEMPRQGGSPRMLLENQDGECGRGRDETIA